MNFKRKNRKMSPSYRRSIRLDKWAIAKITRDFWRTKKLHIKEELAL